VGVEGAYTSDGDYYMSRPYDEIERLVDKYGVRDTLIMVIDVISAKADHISYSWQDEGLAKSWNMAGRIIAKAVRDLPKVPGIK
jgi:hypothetical protein